MKKQLGSHVSLKAPNYFLGSVTEALENGANSLMFYTGSPQTTRRISIEELKIEQGLNALKKNNISTTNLVCHAPYILNLANEDIDKREFSITFLAQELQRCARFNCQYIVLHPGNALKRSIDSAIESIASALDEVFLLNKNNDVMVLLETMAGKGTEVGRSFNEIKAIIDRSKNQDRLGVCLDTCHVFDSGYDLVNDYDNVINDFEKTIGLQFLKVIHINDSKNTLGSRKDRHENIGKGHLGIEVFSRVLNDHRLSNCIFILETPYVDGRPIYKEEIKLLKKLIK